MKKPVLVLFGILALTLAVSAAVKVTVKVPSANVRDRPSTQAAVIGKATRGMSFESKLKVDNWYQVTIKDLAGNDQVGYISADLVDAVETEEPEAAAPAEKPAKPAAAARRVQAEEAETEESADAEPPVPARLPRAMGGSRRGMTFRPYTRLGILLSAPSADDLDYELVGGGSLEQYLDMNASNFGGGLQALFPLNERLSLGLDLGFHTLFSSTFEIPGSGSRHEDSEAGLSMLALAEFRPEGSPLVLQAGAGAHFVHWSWVYDFNGTYYDVHEEDGGNEIGFGLLLGGGVDLPLTDRISLPLMLRIEPIFRYGAMFNAGVSIGLSIH